MDGLSSHLMSSDCPFCHKPMVGHIFQCPNGHYMCRDCHTSARKHDGVCVCVCDVRTCSLFVALSVLCLQYQATTQGTQADQHETAGPGKCSRPDCQMEIGEIRCRLAEMLRDRGLAKAVGVDADQTPPCPASQAPDSCPPAAADVWRQQKAAEDGADVAARAIEWMLCLSMLILALLAAAVCHQGIRQHQACGRTRVSSEFQTPAAGRVTTCRAASCEHERAHTTAREAPAAACHVPPAAHTLSRILLPLFLASELEQSARDNTSRALADFVGECFLEQVRERY